MAESEDEVQVVRGPVVPAGGGIIYQVTLPSGLVLTNPCEFGRTNEAQRPAEVVSLGGRVFGEHEEMIPIGPHA